MAFMYDASSDLALSSSAEKLDACVAATAWVAIRLASKDSYARFSSPERMQSRRCSTISRTESALRAYYEMPRSVSQENRRGSANGEEGRWNNTRG